MAGYPHSFRVAVATGALDIRLTKLSQLFCKQCQLAGFFSAVGRTNRRAIPMMFVHLSVWCILAQPYSL